MVHPVGLLRFRTDLAEGAIEAILKELRCFRQSIRGITGFQGRSYNASEGLAKGFTHGFTMSFADATAHDAYLSDPLHQDLLERLLSMLEGGLDEVMAFQFIDGVMVSDP